MIIRLAIVFLIYIGAATAKELVVDETLTKLDVVPYLTVKLEADPLGPIDILKEGNFEKHLLQESQRPTKNTYWYRLDIKSTLSESKNYYLKTDVHILQYLDFYQINRNRIVSSESWGLKNRTLPDGQYRGVVFPIRLGEKDNTTILIRKQHDGTGLMPLRLLSEEMHIEEGIINNFFWGGIISLLICLAAYNTIIYISNLGLRGWLYPAFQLTAFLHFSASHGFGYLILPTSFVAWLGQHTMFLNFWLAWFGVNFGRTFLESKKRTPSLDKFSRLFLILTPPLALIGYFKSELVLHTYFGPVLTAVFILVISMSLGSYKSGYKPARFFLGSWIFILVGGSVVYLTYSAVIPVNVFTLHSFLIGSLCELILLSVAIADRMRDSESKILTQTLIDQNTELLNKNYYYSYAQRQLDRWAKRHANLYLLVITMEGYFDLVRVLGSTELRRRRKKLALRCFRRLKSFGQLKTFSTPHGERFKMISFDDNLIGMVVDSADGIQTTMAQLLEIWDEGASKDNYFRTVRLRVGTTLLTNHEHNASESFRQAYSALINAKSKDRVWDEYHPRFDKNLSKQLELLSDLTDAIDTDQFFIQIQPKVDLTTQEIVGGEALVRWRHPVKGIIPPCDFIPLAEKSGLIFKISCQVLRLAFNWISLNPQLKSISINLSMFDLPEPRLEVYLDELQFTYEVNPSKIILELTESQSLEQSNEVLTILKRIKNKGYQISIDDFGTGYSSLSYLNKLEPNEIKIDRVFAKDIHKSEFNQVLVKNVVSIAKAFKSRVVIEGVECLEEFELVKKYGCDIGQGFYWSKPIGQSDFENRYLNF